MILSTAVKFQAFCPLREIPRVHAHESPLEEFAVKDIIRGKISDLLSLIICCLAYQHGSCSLNA